MTETALPQGLETGISHDRAGIPIWAIAAHADVCPARSRASFADAVARALPAQPMLVTCHRVEVYGAGSREAAEAAIRSIGEVDASLRVLSGEAAARHVLRLASGLESAVVGEDQILHQVRELRQSLAPEADPALLRLFEMAIAIGRRTRAAIPGTRTTQTLATRAIDWLGVDGGLRMGDRVLVVGAGRMGTLLAREAHRRGFAVTVASRSLGRARSLGEQLGADSLDLGEASRLAPTFRGIAVALSGPWEPLGDAGFAVAAPERRPLPPIVDLSAPPATPPGRPGDGPRLDIDGLYRWDHAPLAGDRAAYGERASELIESALESYRRWAAGRESVETLRTLRERARRERERHVGRLLRRLPGLSDPERALIEEHTEQLVAALLHAPTAQLRDDLDGSAAAAARRLFGI